MYLPRKKNIRRIAALLATVLTAAPSVALADVVLLKGGGRLQGRAVATDDGAVQIEPAPGVRLILPRKAVQSTRSQSAVARRYSQLAAATADTVLAQRRLADWCDTRNLPDERVRHLRRIVELAPHDKEARRALGFVHLKGQWVLPDEYRQERGYHRYRGRWRLAQEIQLIEEKEAREQAELHWRRQLKSLRERLPKDRTGRVIAAIRAVRDPAATPALAWLLERETIAKLRIWYADVLADIGDERAVKTLFDVSLATTDADLFDVSVDHLSRLQPPRLVANYAKALRDENNARVNRAARALRRLDDRSAIGPLIESLVTTHAVTIRPGGANTATFSKPGAEPGPITGGSFTAGRRPYVIHLRARNKQVLQSLTSLTGNAGFGYNVAAWRGWYAGEIARASTLQSPRRQ